MSDIEMLKGKMMSKYFSAFELLCCGETYEKYNPINIPKENKTWEGLEILAVQLLDPLVEKFGRPKITYCFSSIELSKKINRNIYPKLDQHSGSELNSKRKLICGRGGQAVDIFYPHIQSSEIIQWIEKKIKFDRIYFYGNERPFHVSIGPENNQTIIFMRQYTQERRIPKKISIKWLKKFNSHVSN